MSLTSTEAQILQLFLNNLQILLVAIVGRLQLNGLVVSLERLLELVVGEQSQAQATPGLAVARVDLERVLAVLDRVGEVGELRVGGSSVAVVDGVVLVDLDGLVVLLESLLELLLLHELVALGLVLVSLLLEVGW